MLIKAEKYVTYYIVVVIFLSMISCTKQKISLPEELGLPSNIVLSMSMSELKKSRELEPIDSDIGYSEQLKEYRYFDFLTYNHNLDPGLFAPKTLESIGVSRKFDAASPQSESLTNEIIAILRRYYGNPVAELDYGGVECDKMMIWSSNGLTAAFYYISSERFEIIKQKMSVLSGRMYLELSISQDVESYVKPYRK